MFGGREQFSGQAGAEQEPVKGDMFQGQEGEILHLVEGLDEEVFAA